MGGLKIKVITSNRYTRRHGFIVVKPGEKIKDAKQRTMSINERGEQILPKKGRHA